MPSIPNYDSKGVKSMALLDVQDLHVGFQAEGRLVPAVRGVSFKIEAGKVLGLVGESGCGKSVTSLAVMRLLPQPHGRISNGNILFDGTDILALGEDKMRAIRGNAISMIFQEPMTALNPVLAIGEQIGEVLEVHKNMPLKSADNRRRCIELLEMVGIPRAERIVQEYPHQLSGGMRQRVMIAMALACDPRLLIADEPTTALDVTIQAQVLDLMRRLKDELQTAVLFITHDLGVIAEMADEVAVMYAGKIVEQAPVNILFSDPQHPYTIGLMRSRPSQMQKGDALYCIPGMVPSGDAMPTGCAFAPRCEHAQPQCSQLNEIPLVTVDSNHSVRCVLAKGGEPV